MIDVTIWTPTGASDNLPDTDDPLYQMALTSLVIRKNIEALKTGGLSFQKPEISDFTSFNTSLTSWLSSAYARETEIVNNGVSSVAANLPDVLAIGQAYISGGAPAVLGVVATMLLKRAMGDSSARAGYRAGETGPNDLSEVVTELENIVTQLTSLQGTVDSGLLEDEASLIASVKEAILQVLTEFHINLFSDSQTQSWLVGPVDEE